MTNPSLWLDVLARLADRLLSASLSGAVVIAIVWVVCRAVPRLPAGVRATLWWLACARLLVGLLWVTPVPVPVLPASAPAIGWPAADVAAGLAATRATELVGDIRTWRGADAAQPAERSAGLTRHGSPGNPLARVKSPAVSGHAVTSIDVGANGDSPFVARVSPGGGVMSLLAGAWRPLLGLAWLVVTLAAAVRAARAFGRQRALVARAQPLPVSSHAVPGLEAALAVAGSPCGWMLPCLRSAPDIRVSDEIVTPQLVWVGRSVVLVPGALAARGGDALAWAVCHEVVHLRRRDHWTGLVAHAAERLFFFHPLARLAAREFQVHREVACDAEVVRVMDASPRDYGRLLVALGVGGRRSRLAVAGASSSLDVLKRRLIMLQHTSSSPVSRWWRLVGVFALAGVVPLQLVARNAADPSPGVEPLAHTPAPAAAQGLDLAAEGGVRASGSGLQALAGTEAWQAPPPAPPQPPSPPSPPPPPPPPPRHPRDHGFSFSSSEGGASWAYLSGETTMMVNTGAGDARHIESLRKDGAPLFWFERDGKEYVIRDGATLREIEALFAPMRDLDRQQEQIGEQQGELGARQGELGAKQAAIGAKQAAVGAKQAALAAEQAARAAEMAKRAREVEAQARAVAELEAKARAAERAGQQGSPEALARAKADVEAKMRELEAKTEQMERDLERDLEAQMEQLEGDMAPLGKEHDRLGTLQEELAREMEALGRQQDALARQHDRAARHLQDRLRAILDRALAKGTATTIDK